jgi:uncharacterized coiled-coil DUF342 family protein
MNMTAEISFKLFQLTQEFIKDKAKAKEFVSRIEQTLDNKFETKKDILATKNDIAEIKKEIAETKAEIIKWMFIFWVGQILALIAIFNFMMK